MQFSQDEVLSKRLQSAISTSVTNQDFVEKNSGKEQISLFKNSPFGEQWNKKANEELPDLIKPLKDGSL